MSLGLVQPSGETLALTDQIAGEGFKLVPLLDAGAATLQACGSEALHVEVEQDGVWHLADFLDPGTASVVGAGSRFFASGKQASTTYRVVQLPAQQGPAAAAAAAAAGGRGMADPPAAASGLGDRARRYDGLGLGSDGTVSSPSSKRQRQEEGDAEAGPRQPAQQLGPATSAAAAGAGADPLDRLPDAPFHLLRVQEGIPAWANKGFLGVRLADLVRGPMKLVLVSNYMVDLRWLLSACPDLARVERLIVVHGEDPLRVAQIREDLAAASSPDNPLASRTAVFKPPLPIEYGTHHSKAFLIQYQRGLRVVIHTANMIYPDCNNKTQAVWWQDFPPKDDQSPATSEFEQDLLQYLRALSLIPSVARAVEYAVKAHDFSAARGRLAGSVPGRHIGDRLHSWGHLRLRACLGKEEFPAAFAGAPLVAQFSSLGSLDAKWLEGEFRASLSAGRAPGGQRLGPPAAQGPAGFQLLWPTVEEIQNSIEGWAAGTSVPGPIKNVSKPFLQPYWHSWAGDASGRQRAAPHIKTYGRYLAGEGEQGMAWFLITSSNLSKAAWGALQKNSTQLFIRSYELGLLVTPSLERAYRASRWRGFSCTSATPFPPPAGDEADVSSVRFVRWARGAPQAAAAGPGGLLTVPLPVPYTLPPTPYGPGDKPWAVDVAWPGVDIRGASRDSPRGCLYGLLDSQDWMEAT